MENKQIFKNSELISLLIEYVRKTYTLLFKNNDITHINNNLFASNTLLIASLYHRMMQLKGEWYMNLNYAIFRSQPIMTLNDL